MTRTALLVACTLASPVVLAEGDISGTWMSGKPVTALKTAQGEAPPLKPEALAIHAARLAQARRGDRSWDPVAKCKPPGEPRTMLESSWPFEIMQSPQRVDFLFQWNRLDRAIAIAATLERDALAPFYFGQSNARWDGDTLVVNMIAQKDGTMLDASGLPHSEDMVLTERFRTIDGGRTLEARLHIDDPATFTRPWDTVLTFRRMPAGTRIVEDVCMERLKLDDYATLGNSLQR